MFDLTSEIKLSPAAQKKYTFARILLHLAFLAGAAFVADRILFPSAELIFSFGNANSLKNTLVAPRTAAEPDVLAKSSVTANSTLVFNANPLGNFSDASISFTTDKNSQSIEKSSIGLRKSYQAFFYPIGDPIGFRDGTLLTTADGAYYIVSTGALRKFSNTDIILKLGYPKSAFLQVSPSDLQYNQVGENISDTNTYPDDTFFAIGDTYYQLKDNQMYPFVSTRAFLSQFDAIQAIIKDDSFFNQYPLSEIPLGFADGTLASSNQSVFILSEGKSYPIESADTFAQMGFGWDNVIAMDSDEIGLYAQQKQFTHDQPHPNGTLFMDQKTQDYFVIENKEKHPIKNAAIVKTYSKQKPIVADSDESKQNVSCQLKKTLFGSNSYTCNLPLETFAAFIGNDYQIDVTFTDNAKIKDISMIFSTPLTGQNMRSSLSRIKTGLKNNYTQQQ